MQKMANDTAQPRRFERADDYAWQLWGTVMNGSVIVVVQRRLMLVEAVWFINVVG
jgi:hypothetical protein